MIERFLMRAEFWRRYGRLLLAVRLCELLVTLRSRALAERIVPIVGGPEVTAVGVRHLLDVLEDRAA